MTRKKRLATIGAAPAGLGAARQLSDHDDSKVVVFEKSSVVFGRAATRSRHGMRLDPGANYFRTGLPGVAELIHGHVPTDGLIEIGGAVCVFDKGGTISAGDSSMNVAVKWTYAPGAGWINFDPTNRSVRGFNLVPVAVARDITLLMPVSGSYVGAADAFAGMEVEVRVD